MQRVKTVMYVPDGTTEDQINSGEVKPSALIVPVPLVRTSINSSLFTKNREVNDMPSVTVPNQAMTVRELMVRFAAGLPLEGGRAPLYEGDTSELPDIEKMDIIEQNLYYKELQEERDKAIDRIKAAKKTAEEKKMEKIIAERVAKKKEEEEKKAFDEWKKNQGGNV